MEELLAVVGADSLALDMSIGAAAEQASVQGMASMALGDEGALDALLYPLVAGVQRRSALRSPLPRVARPTLCLSLLFLQCVLGAALTGPLLLPGMASSAHEQQPISLDGEVCGRHARDFCVARLTRSRSLPFRRSGVAFVCVLERPRSAAAPPLAASSQRQEPCVPRATAGRCWSR
jgi:hypothetical protein